jgi:hypothetical protein
LHNQLEVDLYVAGVKSGGIAIGKPITFISDNNAEGSTCASQNVVRMISVLGYAKVNIYNYSQGTFNVGDFIEISGSGIVFDQKNTLFFPDPAGN